LEIELDIQLENIHIIIGEFRIQVNPAKVFQAKESAATDLGIKKPRINPFGIGSDEISINWFL
jgi:hypothetical protein